MGKHTDETFMSSTLSYCVTIWETYKEKTSSYTDSWAGCCDVGMILVEEEKLVQSRYLTLKLEWFNIANKEIMYVYMQKSTKS